MSDRLDVRIRELFEELDKVAPAAPPLPSAREKEQPVWPRWLIPAGSVAVVILVIGLVGPLMRGSDESGVADSTVAPETTQVAAEGDASEGIPGSPRPADTALALAQMNLACAAFVEVSSAAVPTDLGTDTEYQRAISGLETPITRLVAELGEIAEGLDDPQFDSIVADVESTLDELKDAAAGSVEPAMSFSRLVGDISALGIDLFAYGALDCDQLTATIS